GRAPPCRPETSSSRRASRRNRAGSYRRYHRRENAVRLHRSPAAQRTGRWSKWALKSRTISRPNTPDFDVDRYRYLHPSQASPRAETQLCSGLHHALGRLVIMLGKPPNVIDKDGADLFVPPFSAIEHDDCTRCPFLLHVN